MFKQLIDAICFRLINGPLGGPAPAEFQIARLDLKPGDVFVIRFRQRLSAEQAERMRKMWDERFPGMKAVVVEGDVDFSVLTKPVELREAA